MSLHDSNGQQYQKRISGPILERIDIYLDVPRASMQKLAALDGGEPSASIRARMALSFKSRSISAVPPNHYGLLFWCQFHSPQTTKHPEL